MRKLRALFLRVIALFSGRRRDRELDDELESNLQMQIEDNLRRGMPPDEARYAALRGFGNVTLVKEELRELWSFVWLEQFWRDVRVSLRQLRRSPGFTSVAVLTLALGIGANAAIFSVVNAVLLKPLTYPAAGRMVEFFHRSASGASLLANNLASIPMFRLYQRQTGVFEDVAAYDFTSPGFNLTGDRPEQLHGIHVSEGYFRLFGARAMLGRTFTPAEDSPHGGNVVVLSYGLWQRRFGGDPGIVGKILSLGNEPYTIVGVIGREFFSDPEADIWLPFQFEPESTNGNQYFQAAARLKPGITLAEANAQMQLATAEYYRRFPGSDPSKWEKFSVEPLRDLIVGDARWSLEVMLGAVGMVLLIACANVANLLLVRATGRKRELAIRRALGSSRRRLIRQLLTESVLLSLAGAVLGLLVGFAGVRALLAVSPAGLPRVGENGSAVAMDWRVLVFTLAIALLTGILFGLFPAFAAARTDLTTALKESGDRSGTGFRTGKTRALLVVSEVSLALVLLIGAALLIRTFISLRAVSAGFDAHNVLTAEMSMTGARLHTTAGIAALSHDARTRLNAMPEVEVAASTVWLPNQVDDALAFQIAGHPEKGWMGGRWMSFSPGYLSVFKIPVLRGRDFRETDTLAAPRVALVNQAFAGKYWPNQDPVGQYIQIDSGMGVQSNEPPRTIVGVVGDTHNNGLGKPPDPMMMVPTAQVVDWYAAAYSDTSAMIWVARTRGDPHQAIASVTEQLRLASRGLPVAHVRTMEEVMGRSTARQSFNMLLLTIFGAVALILAAIGIYGLMAYSVGQRTQEIGIRMALGANPSAIAKLVVWQGMRLTLVGVAGGIAAAFGLARVIATFLFGVKPWDPAVFICAPLVLAAVAFVAAWLPARRASKLDPMLALRME